MRYTRKFRRFLTDDIVPTYVLEVREPLEKRVVDALRDRERGRETIGESEIWDRTNGMGLSEDVTRDGSHRMRNSGSPRSPQ